MTLQKWIYKDSISFEIVFKRHHYIGYFDNVFSDKGYYNNTESGYYIWKGSVEFGI